MRIKLDENLGSRGAQRLREAGHEVGTVAEQGLCAATDFQLAAACQKEKRCLISLDLDFANPLVFKPTDYSGIAVLRLPPKSTVEDLYGLVETLITELKQDSIEGDLWIVQPGKIRQYQPEKEMPQ